MFSMLVKVGWKKEFVKNCVPFMPISGWVGDNLLKKSDKMPWWKGADVKSQKKPVHCDTLLDCLAHMVKIPKRPLKKPLRMPVSGIYKIKGDVMIVEKDETLKACASFTA